MKRLTVIVPGYRNSKERWRRCVASLLRATNANDCIICVDDGSDYAQLEDSWISSDNVLDERIQILRLEKNVGLASARNIALDRTSSKFVTFVDSDDEVVPGVFDKCIEKLENSGADIAVYGVKPIWVDEGLTKKDVPDDGVLGELSAERLKLLRDKCLLNYACNKIYSVDFLRRQPAIRFNPGGMPCEDIIFNLECVSRHARWCAVSEIGYIYYREGGSLLSRYKKSNVTGLRACQEAWKKCRAMFPDWEEVFGNEPNDNDGQIVRAEWRNIWMPQSPYSFLARLQWCVKHQQHLGRFAFLKMMIFSFLRRYCYIRPIRRWNIRRTYRNVVEFVPTV